MSSFQETRPATDKIQAPVRKPPPKSSAVRKRAQVDHVSARKAVSAHATWPGCAVGPSRAIVSRPPPSRLPFSAFLDSRRSDRARSASGRPFISRELLCLACSAYGISVVYPRRRLDGASFRGGVGSHCQKRCQKVFVGFRVLGALCGRYGPSSRRGEFPPGRHSAIRERLLSCSTVRSSTEVREPGPAPWPLSSCVVKAMQDGYGRHGEPGSRL